MKPVKTKCVRPRAVWALLVFAAFTACKHADSDTIQGYIEGEYLYMASPLGGQLETLSVARGGQVKKGELLFALDCVTEKAAVDEAGRRLAQSKARLEDLKKGQRPSEMASLEARLKQARAAMDFSTTELARVDKLFRGGNASTDQLDQANMNHRQNTQAVAQLEADLETAKLGARSDQVTAGEADVAALTASLDGAKWNLMQKQQFAPKDAFVFDTLYRPGEWITAGQPAVVLLPPEYVKVRAFVPETRIGSVKAGDHLRVHVDGVASTFTGTVNYISPQAEYTPPVIYSRESREKLVFMIEAVFEPEAARQLHPGQPVEVELAR